jgi:diguanylate cyclase (GGDEF)-like protein
VRSSDAKKTAERARENIESSSATNDPETKVTASFGIATINPHTESLTQMIDQADKALYMSKENGRNCITVWDQEAECNESGEPVSSSHQATTSIHTDGSSEDNSRSTNEADLKPEHDSLTGLPNRSIFHTRIIDEIKHCRATGKSMAVMMLDLDMFKRINNALGYQVGDNLLTTISTRLQEVLRKTDSISRFKNDDTNTSIYRLGGDEFGILLSGMNGTEFTEQIVKRILDTVTEPLEIDGNEIHLTSSIGISQFSGTGTPIDKYSLLNNAGMALFHAKRNGHNTYKFYDKELSNDSLDSLKLENDLRHALEHNELELHYQPKVKLFSGKITGMEALVRWKHPTIGMIPPVEFIPLAEETGLIVQLGEWVLNTACKKLKEWESTGYKNISIAVNLSAVQFRQNDLLGMIQGIISSTGANPELLELEITESTIMEDLDSASAAMRELHNEGIQISIDDFGTGYSSLNHLKRFPISAVKIDRSFIRDLTKDPDDAAIVGAIISMAHGMGLKIIAEGVETEQQLEYLHRLRCDEIQGFLFSKALPEDEIEELLKQDKAGTAFPDTQFKAVS